MKLMVIDGNSIVNRAFYGVSQNLSKPFPQDYEDCR